MIDVPRKMSSEELLLLAHAAADFQAAGKTERTCPRCQQMLTYFANKTGCIVSCKGRHCIRTTFRGVMP